MSEKILQSQGSTLVLIDCHIDETENVITAKMSYFESGLAKITEVKDNSTGEIYKLIVPQSVLDIATYAVDLERSYDLD